MVKQYVKSLNKNYVCKVKASHFSMGNSLNVNVCMKDGSPIPNEEYQKINSFVNLFRYGRFDGMTDYYEYEEAKYETDNGNIIEGACKYVSVDNRPKFGTTEWIVNEVKNEGRDFENAAQYVDNQKVIEKAKLQLN